MESVTIRVERLSQRRNELPLAQMVDASRAVDIGMGRMDDRLLRIFIMRFCGASHSSVARVLGCSRQSAGYLWLRALECIPSLDEIETAGMLSEIGNPSPASVEPVAV